MDFPRHVSFTLTNACNLRCRMCAQWSEEGYIRATPERRGELTLDAWKGLVDELAAHQVKAVLLRGGEPFLFPEIVPLMEHIHARGIFTAIDTNGTQLERFAADIVRLGDIHLTVSVDGPEPVHDQVRGVPGTFARLRAGLARLTEEETAAGKRISRSICFVISPWSLPGLGVMPDVARDLGIETMAIVPYYYMPGSMGREYTAEMQELFGCAVRSWRGFHHESSGVDLAEFERQLAAYRAGLKEITDYPYMPFSLEEYQTWFGDPRAPVGVPRCGNVESLIDIQPDGGANFCVDYADYIVGNVCEATIAEIWRSERAERFRAARRRRPFAACHRCGSRYMAETP